MAIAAGQNCLCGAVKPNADRLRTDDEEKDEKEKRRRGRRRGRSTGKRRWSRCTSWRINTYILQISAHSNAD
jgi:hypothetical protein